MNVSTDDLAEIEINLVNSAFMNGLNLKNDLEDLTAVSRQKLLKPMRALME